MTTPSSTTSANPNGTFTVSESLRPTRAWHDGAWKTLNPTLRRGRHGTISPAVTSNALALSAGGSSTLAVMTADGRSLTLSWPGTLPAPTLSGPTATYPGVFPGVDLVVTADDQGGFSDTLVVHTAAAAANPALASLKLGVSSSGLTLSADSAGDLSAVIAPGDPAVITTQVPQIWDSTPPPAGMPTVTSQDGTLVNAATGQPAYSSATAPGAAAHVASVPVTLSAGTLTLSPPASVLTGPGITYPVYIDPTWHNSASSEASAWTQVDSGFPSQSYWHESSDMQVGDCPSSLGDGSCNGMGVARSFVRLPIPSVLHSTTDIHSAYLYMTENWAPSCTKKSVRLYRTGAIRSGTTWNNQPSWSSDYLYQDAAFGYPGCPQGGYYKNDITWDVTSTIANDAGGQDTQTWGLRAADETDQYGWKTFRSGSENLTLSVTYNYPPNTPTSLSTSPGGSCHTSSSDPAQIGDDDVTFSAYVSDNDGDNDLTTRFVIHNPDGSTPYDSSTAGTSVHTGDKTDARLPLPRSVIQALHADGNTVPYTYYWQAQTTDEFSLTSQYWSEKCWFTYNPTGPSQPGVKGPTGPVPLGTSASFTFSPPPGCSPTTTPCPVSYTYQLGSSPPVTENNLTSGDWTGDITITRAGPLLLSVYGTSAGGNPGEIATFPVSGSAPSPPYPDGYFHGGSYPDVLTIGTGTHPSLWLSTGSGNGTVNPPVDVGSLGTGISPGSDGPADWAGADILHGQFTGNGVQDVMAYYPSGASQGTAVIIGGTGDQSTLVPSSGNTDIIPPGTNGLTDQSLCVTNPDGSQTCPYPTDLVAASDASGAQPGTGLDDLIGILGNSGDPSSYELGLFANTGLAGGYSFVTALSTSATSPGGDSWQNYTLATAQPGCYPGSTSGCNQGDVTLFVLDDSTGALWVTTVASGSIGSWTPITPVPWGAQAPTLVSADINPAGQTELWVKPLNTASITAYTLSGSTLTQEGTQPANAPLDEWPLTDGSQYAQTSSATTATDTTGGNTATLTGCPTDGSCWNPDDDYFSADIAVNGSTEYLTTPGGTISPTDTTPKITVWFRTTTPGGVLVSLDSDPLPAAGGAGTSTGSFDPVLYIGTDGHLYGEWWNGSALSPAVSARPVDDGLWHRAVLTGHGTWQTLYVDSQPGVTISGTINLTNQGSNLSFGGGYIARNWPSEPYYQQSDGHADYFTGDIASITSSYPGGP